MKKISIAFSVSLAYILCLMVIFGQPGFETNDDVLMAMQASGTGFAEVADEHLIYTHFLIGLVLKFLYQLSPELPWYGLYILTFQTMALTIILFLLQKRFSSNLYWLTIPYLLFAYTKPFLIIQFTTTAALVATAAAALLLEAMAHRRHKALLIRYTISSIILFSLASMVRAPAALLILILTALFILVKLAGKSLNRGWKLPIATLSIALISMFLLFTWNRNYYAGSSEWKHLYPHQQAVWKLVDTERLKQTDPVTRKCLKTAGWSTADVDMFYQWYSLDPQFDDKTLVELEKSLPRPPLKLKTLREVEDVVKDRTSIPALLLIALATIFVSSYRLSPNPGLRVAIFLISMVAIVLSLAIQIKLPPRVYTALLVFSSTMLVLNISPNRIKEITSYKPNALGILLATGILLIISFQGFQSITELTNTRRMALKDFSQALKHEKDRVYISLAADLPIECIGLMENPNLYFQGLSMLGFNSSHYSAAFYEKLKQISAKAPMNELDRKEIRLLSREQTNDVIRDYVLEHYNREPVFHPYLRKEGIEVRAYRVSYRDKDWKRPEIEDNTVILYPGELPPVFENCKLLEKERGMHSFKVTGRNPVVSIPIKIPGLKSESYTSLFVELGVKSRMNRSRRFAIWLADEKRSGHHSSKKLFPDSKMHTYFIDMEQFMLRPESRIIHINLTPLIHKRDAEEETFILGRLGLIRKD